MENEKLYTVKEICTKYHITRKTLFYYDKTGLVKPAQRVGTQFHKLYDWFSVSVLEKVLTYRNAGLTIMEIREMMRPLLNMQDYVGILEKARKRLLKEKSRKEEELRNLETLIAEIQKRNSNNK